MSTKEELFLETLRRERIAPLHVPRIPRRPGPREGEASFAQKRIWIQQMLDPESTSYNILMALRIDGALSVPAAQQALQAVVDRHESLRTGFRPSHGQPVQWVQPRLPAPLALVDAAPAGEDRRLLDEVLAARQRIRFTLERPPLFDFALIRLSDRVSVLALTIHHIVFDFVSSQVLFEEFAELYRAYVRGLPATLPEGRIQYLDYAEWQRKEFEGTHAARRLEHWKERFGTGAEVPVTEVPGDRPWRPGAAFVPMSVPFSVPEPLAARVREVAADAGVSSFVVWLTAFQLLLHRYTGAERVLVSVPHAERVEADLERVVGFFVNFIVVHLRVRREAGFRDTLRAVHEAYLETIGEHAVPFDRLVEALSPARHQGITRLGEVGFGYQRTARSRWELDDLSLSFVEANVPIAKSELALSVFESPDASRAHVEYNGARFSRGMVEAMTGEYLRLLASLLEAPERPVGAATASPPAPERLPAPVGGSATLAALFERAAREHPDGTALAVDGVQVSYAALNRRANRMARRLVDAGVWMQDVVAVLQPRGVEAYVNVLAVLKCGAAYLPLDPAHPPDYLARLVEASDAAHLLAGEGTEAIREAVARGRAQVIEARAAPGDSAGDGRDLRLPVDPAHVAYVCFTSGSTGASKGVAVTHGAAAAHVAAFARAVPIGRADRVLQFAAFSFDVSIEQMFAAWSVGAAVVPRGDEVWGVREFAEFLEAEAVTVANPPTAYWNQVVRVGASTGVAMPASLRCLIAGGEAMASESVALWAAIAAPGTRLLNGYGPTEAVITATLHDVSPADAEEGPTAPIGRALPGHRAHAGDGDGFPVPQGAVGELWLGGPCLALGYLGSPRRTAERFRPFAGEGAPPGSRTYRSGDRVQARVDGELRFLDRVDDEIKLRGVRVNPGVVESVLLEHRGILEGALVMREGPAFRLAANGAHAPDDDEAWSALLARIPPSVLDAALSEAEAGGEGPGEADAAERVVSKQAPEFVLSLRIRDPGFLATARDAQRNWVIDRALEECAEDLHAWQALSRSFVAGTDRDEIPGDLAAAEPALADGELVIAGQQVMQAWQAPLMRELARAAAEGHGDVLEVGFGMGLSAGFVQEIGVRTHVIVEANPRVAEEARRWRERYPASSIRIVEARWEDVVEEMEEFDGILFDSYPLTESEFRRHVIGSATFAAHFFPAAARRLRPGGVLTYYSNEVDSIGRRHQRALLAEFSSFRVNVVRGLRPPAHSQNWWADSMAVVRAYRE